MSVLEKSIYGSDYFYIQYRDTSGKKRAFYVGKAKEPNIERKKRAVLAAYHLAFVEDRLKKWFSGIFTSKWPVRPEWLEKAREGGITDEDRRRAVTLAYGILHLFHEDICQHKNEEECIVRKARDQIRRWTL
jgi:hypothetical protein